MNTVLEVIGKTLAAAIFLPMIIFGFIIIGTIMVTVPISIPIVMAIGFVVLLPGVLIGMTIHKTSDKGTGE